MSNFSLGVSGGSCVAIKDGEYPTALANLIRSAKRHCLCSLFIIDFAGEHPGFVDILDALEDVVWIGVDVRIVIGGSRENYSIAETAASARAVFAGRHIPCRWIMAQPNHRGSHAKLIVVDDTVLLGSHNWSLGAFGGQIQDSILVDSPALAAYLASIIHEQWLRGEG